MLKIKKYLKLGFILGIFCALFSIGCLISLFLEMNELNYLEIITVTFSSIAFVFQSYSCFILWKTDLILEKLEKQDA